MFNKRKRYSSEFKAKVAVEALKEQKTLSALALEFSMHPNQIVRRKKQILDNSPEIFNRQVKSQKRRQSSLEDELYRQIGQLKVEIDRLEKNSNFSLDGRRALVEQRNNQISVVRQCHLLNIHRSGFYYEPRAETSENLFFMRMIDEQYLHTPFYGVRRMHAKINAAGHAVNIKRIRRLMRLMGLEAIYPKPRTSQPAKGDRIYPYLLDQVKIINSSQVWSTDITYIPMKFGFMYLTAVMDWYSRYVLARQLSNSLETGFCLEALEKALKIAKPDIFNSNQGSQFTGRRFTDRLESSGIRISMDGRRRALDNVFIERLWRSLKYEYVYLHAPENGRNLHDGLEEYFRFYNKARLHQALNYRTPAEIYFKN